MMSEKEPSNDAAQTALEDPETPIDSSKTAPPVDTRPGGIVMIGPLLRRCLAQWRPILLAALVLAAIGLAVGLFFFQYRPDRQIDDAAARQAIRAASDGTVAVLSYSSDKLELDFANAKSHLTGDFLDYYNKFSQGVVALAVRDKHLTQKTAVIRAAVSQLHPDSAVVLMFVNETTTSKKNPKPLVTPSIVRVTMTKVSGSWLISKLDPLS
jgi:Mce-associated membrane protein